MPGSPRLVDHLQDLEGEVHQQVRDLDLLDMGWELCPGNPKGHTREGKGGGPGWPDHVSRPWIWHGGGQRACLEFQDIVTIPLQGLWLILCLLLGDDRLQAFGLQVAIFDLLQPVLDEGVGGVVLIKNFTLGLGLEVLPQRNVVPAPAAWPQLVLLRQAFLGRLPGIDNLRIFSPGSNSPVKVSEIGGSAKSSLTPLRSSASRVNINRVLKPDFPNKAW